jgi:5-(aminomethyl)-3-furanmethanol phosphate kinase
MFTSPTVIKVGGSLFDLPDLGGKLARMLNMPGMRKALLVPGGGATANVVREWDRCHGLGEETSHWLALHALALNARFLAKLLPAGTTEIVDDLDQCRESWRQGRWPIINLYAMARADEGRPGCLPHRWSVTSDSLALRMAFLIHARRLILLKSASLPEGIDWDEASRRRFVDSYFGEMIRGTRGLGQEPLEIQTVNFRTWSPTRPIDSPSGES